MEVSSWRFLLRQRGIVFREQGFSVGDLTLSLQSKKIWKLLENVSQALGAQLQ